MSIAHYENLIQEKRKKTPFRNFVKEIGSWIVLSVYKNNEHISRYPDTNRTSRVVSISEYASISPYQKEYDVGSSFLDQFDSVMTHSAKKNLLQFWENENSNFCDSAFGAKNAYLSFQIWWNAENILYSAFCYENVSAIIGSFFVTHNSTEVYMSWGIDSSSRIFYSRYVRNSRDIWFSSNLIGCHECISCDNLENQSYCIDNITLSKETYREKKAKILQERSRYEEYAENTRKVRGMNIVSENVEGANIFLSKNVKNGGWISRYIDSRNILIWNGWDQGSYNCFDCIDTGMNIQEYYAVCSAWYNSHHIYCSTLIWESSSYCYYSMDMENSHHCLGCIGLKNKSYCILNKQYTKEEWEILAEQIFASMEDDGTLGDFFPASMCPFYFNDTLAYLIDDSFTKEEVEANGYLWRDEPIQVDIPEWLEVVKSTELDRFQWFRETEWHIDPSILDKVIIDTEWNYYRIVQMEYAFLMRHALPLPTTHWLDRIKMGFR